MQESIKIIPVNAEVYSAFYTMVQSTQWGNPMLPMEYNDKLWGDVIYLNEEIIGGWVGTVRGDIPVARIITKSVYFDSYPIFKTKALEEQYLPTLIGNIKNRAKKDGVVMLNLTHWVRGTQALKLDVVSHIATFYCDLSQTNDELHKKMDRLKKRCIRKAEESNLDTQFYYKEDAIPYIPEFLKIRELTQKRAIQNNKNASMLLKSQAFFEDLFKNCETTLLTIRVDGLMVAAATFIQGGNTIYAHMSGSLAEYNKSTGAGTYYYWAAMQYFKEKNIRFYDFGGAPYNPAEDDPAYGVYTFKKGFGAEYYTGIEGKIIISKLKFNLLNFALSQRKLLRFISNKI